MEKCGLKSVAVRMKLDISASMDSEGLITPRSTSRLYPNQGSVADLPVVRLSQSEQHLQNLLIASDFAQSPGGIHRHLKRLVLQSLHHGLDPDLFSFQDGGKVGDRRADMGTDFKIGIFERHEQMSFDVFITIIEHLQGLHNIAPDEGNLFEIPPEPASNWIGGGSVNEHVEQSGDLFPIMGEANQFHAQVAVRPSLAGEQRGRPMPVTDQIVFILHHLEGVIVSGGALVGGS